MSAVSPAVSRCCASVAASSVFHSGVSRASEFIVGLPMNPSESEDGSRRLFASEIGFSFCRAIALLLLRRQSRKAARAIARSAMGITVPIAAFVPVDIPPAPPSFAPVPVGLFVPLDVPVDVLVDVPVALADPRSELWNRNCNAGTLTVASAGHLAPEYVRDSFSSSSASPHSTMANVPVLAGLHTPPPPSSNPLGQQESAVSPSTLCSRPVVCVATAVHAGGHAVAGEWKALDGGAVLSASQGRHALLRGGTVGVASSSAELQVAPYLTVEDVSMSVEHAGDGVAAHGVDQGN